MVDGFIWKFSFEDDFLYIYSSLHTINNNIFENSAPRTWKQPNWVVQIEHVLECYNLIVEEEDDPRNVDKAESEGHREVNGPKPEIQDITKPLNTKKVNI